MEEECTINSSEIEYGLSSWLSDARKVVIAGIGNPLRRDDFVGVEIVRNLQDKVSQLVYLIECEIMPENFIEPIIEFKPTHILLIDASLLNLKPGSSKLMLPDQMTLTSPVSTSTHALPLQIFCKYLAKTTNAQIALLAIQPKDTNFGEGLTSELQKTATQLTDLLLKILP